MRRLALLAAILAGLTVAASAALADDGNSDGDYVVRAYFDNGSFTVDGQDVRVGGANVGVIESVDVSLPGEQVSYEEGEEVQPGTALVVLKIQDPGYKRFLADASCILRPQSLIGERFVDCKTTEPRAATEDPPPELEQIPEGQPGEGQYLLPLENNGRTVDIDLVNNVYREPFRDRFRLILNELGAGFATRGEDLQEIIERADPTLREGNKVLAKLAAQRKTLQRLTRDSDRVLENVALVRNTDLAPESPESLEDMAATGLALVDSGEATIPVGWQQPDTYHNYWVVTGDGGYVFGQTDEGYDGSDLGIDSEGGLAAGETFTDLVERGFLSESVTYDVMLESFANGETPYAVTGPWAVAEFTDVPYVVEPLPTVDGGEPAPFVGVQGFYVSAFSENALAAQTFVLDVMGTEEAQVGLYEVGNRPPALQSAFDQASSDPDIQGFGEAGADGYAMPSIPEMNSVWESWDNAYTLIMQGEDGAEAFTEAADQIRNQIG